MSNANRQAKFKAKMAECGLVQVNVWLPAHAAAEFQLAAEIIRDAKRCGESLSVARLVNHRTGRLIGLRARPTASNGVAQ